MKKQLYLFCLLFAILALPLMVYAQDHSPLLTVNHLTYQAENTPLIIKETLYLSGQDLADITYGTYTQTEQMATLKIQSHVFTYDLLTGQCTHNNVKYLPEARIQLIDQSLVYFPITVLTDSQYPFTYENEHLSLNTLEPYSTATDRASDHKKLDIHLDSFDALFAPLSSTLNISALVADAKKEHTYLSLLSVDHKKESFRMMKNLIDETKTTSVHFRHVDYKNTGVILGHFDTFPIQYRIDDDVLSLSFNKNKFSSSNFWATYDPYNITTDIDINKSLDVMLMRLLYEYYRDHLELKDDLWVSPVLKTTCSRSDAMTYDVYFPNDESHQIYQLIIYKKTGSETIDFYIDLIKHP